MSNITVTKEIISKFIKKNGKTRVYIRVIYERQDRRFKIPSVEINPNNWEKDKGKIKKNEPRAIAQNLIISKYYDKALRIVYNCEHESIPFNFDHFKFQLFNQGYEADFHEFCEKAIVNDSYASETVRGYENHLEKLKKYAPKLKFVDLTESFFNTYFNYLINNRGNSQSTANRNLKTFKTLINKAIRQGLIKENPLKNVSLNSQAKPVTAFLTLDEFALLYDYYQEHEDFTFKRKETLRAFLFACCTGLRPNDIHLLKFENLKGNKLVFTEHKTGNDRSIFLIPEALDFIDKDRCKLKSQSLFLLAKEQTTNKHLKLFAKDINAKYEKKVIREDIAFKFSRRTFVTLHAEATGDIFLTSKTVGHSKVTITESHYAGMTDKRKEEGLEKFGEYLFKQKSRQ